MLPAEAQRARRPAVLAAGPLTLALATALVAVGGCGDSDDGDEGEDGAPARTELTVTVDPDGPGGAEPLSKTLSCDGADGAGDPACDAASELPPDPGAPVPPETPCTEIFGGPDEVTVSGTIAGEDIDATLTRQNGCEIERFGRFQPLLGALFPDYEPGGAPVGG